ncbi:unnamed protein product, partial [Polarella glacialis]
MLCCLDCCWWSLEPPPARGRVLPRMGSASSVPGASSVPRGPRLTHMDSGDGAKSALASSPSPKSRMPFTVMSRKGTYALVKLNLERAVQLLVVSDPGQDLDDELMFVLLRCLSQEGQVDVLGIITTLAPSYDRARLCRGTLDILGLYDVPVGLGTDGGDHGGDHKASTFEEWAESYMPKPGSHRMSSVEPGRQLFFRLYQDAAPKSVTLLITASLKDPALFLRDNEILFFAKTKEVVIMGGVEPWTEAQGKDRTTLLPDTAHNQEFDREASEFLFRKCQEMGVPLVVVSRFAAYAAK